jgi:hypothetical protein
MAENYTDKGKLITEYCRTNGACRVWQSWLDNMQLQDREVKPEYLFWETLPDRDKTLDANIAYDLINDFLAWLGYKKLKEGEEPCIS